VHQVGFYYTDLQLSILFTKQVRQ